MIRVWSYLMEYQLGWSTRVGYYKKNNVLHLHSALSYSKIVNILGFFKNFMSPFFIYDSTYIKSKIGQSCGVGSLVNGDLWEAVGGIMIGSSTSQISF